MNLNFLRQYLLNHCNSCLCDQINKMVCKLADKFKLVSTAKRPQMNAINSIKYYNKCTSETSIVKH